MSSNDVWLYLKLCAEGVSSEHCFVRQLLTRVVGTNSEADWVKPDVAPLGEVPALKQADEPSKGISRRRMPI